MDQKIIKNDVYVQDQYTRFFDFYIRNIIQETNFVENITRDTNTCVVPTGIFTEGDAINIKENNRFYQGIVLNVVVDAGGDTLIVDSAFDYEFTTSAIVQKTTRNLAVDGSITPQIFVISTKGLVDTKFDITSIFFKLESQSPMDTQNFGGIDALTNGVLFRLKDGIFINYMNFKTNGELGNSCETIQYEEKAPSGYYGLRAVKKITGNNGVTIRLDSRTEDELQVIVNDDLTGLTNFNVIIHGHYVED